MGNGIKIDQKKFETLSVKNQRSAQFEAISDLGEMVSEFKTDITKNTKDITWLTWGIRFVFLSIIGICYFIIRSGMLK